MKPITDNDCWLESIPPQCNQYQPACSSGEMPDPSQVQACPTGLFFENAMEACVFPGQVQDQNCQVQPDPACMGNMGPNQMMATPNNPSSFIICEFGYLSGRINCPEGAMFDENLQQCVDGGMGGGMGMMPGGQGGNMPGGQGGQGGYGGQGGGQPGGQGGGQPGGQSGGGSPGGSGGYYYYYYY